MTARHRPDRAFAGWHFSSMLTPFAPACSSGFGTGRRRVRCRRPQRPASVWSVAQRGHPEVRPIEGWLLVAIVVIAAAYTRAGHCVLLFGLPCRIGEASAVGPAPAMMQSTEGLFAGLIEVAGAVTRLGRTVEAHVAELGFCRNTTAVQRGRQAEVAHGLVEPDKTPTGQGSERGLIAKSARQMVSGHRQESRRQMPTVIRAGRLSAVIVSVDPYDSDRVPGVMRSGLLAQSGMLAFLVRSGGERGQLLYICSPLVQAGHCGRLGVLNPRRGAGPGSQLPGSASTARPFN